MKISNAESKYKKPTITTYTEEEILDLIGPANTYGSYIGNLGLHLGWNKGKGNPHHN
jgi:hypothetical protein